jgi:hypothetical protein
MNCRICDEETILTFPIKMQPVPICNRCAQTIAVHLAMRFPTKPSIIAFGDWLQFNYQPHAEAGFWYDHHNDEENQTPISTRDLFRKWDQTLRQ